MVGLLPSSMTINLELVFSIRNPRQFSACLASIEIPGSPNYHHFLNARTLAPYIPSPGDKASVAAFLRHEGFTVSEGPSPLVIRFAGTASAVESVFGVKLNMFEQNSRRFFAATSDPILPLNFAAMTVGVVGLDNYTVAKPAETPCGYGGSPDCPQGVQVGYNVTGLYTAGFNGSGVTVAVVDMPGDPDPQGAINTFDAQYGLPSVTLNLLYPDGTPTYYDPGWGIETALDIEAVHSMAPGAGITLLYDQVDPVNAIDYVATNHIASVVTDSWGIPYPDTWLSSSYLNSTDSRLMVDTAQGLTILFASGDRGSGLYGFGTEFPASDPNVLSVGGTNLNLTGCTGVTCTGYGSEEGAVISGGGYSGYFSEPVWQTAALGSLPGRGVPDVSALGLYPYFWVYSTYEGWEGVAGTSLSSPLWAGFLAVAFQFAGWSSVGNIDPLIYTLGSGTSYSSVFHDVVTGSNDYYYGNYSAGPGWDPVTGWGSPIADQLAHALATMPTISLSPSLGNVGISVTISGFNLLASSDLTVTYDNSTAGMPTTCTTDAYGDINSGCTFTVPSSAVGPHYVTVTDGTNSPMAIFYVPVPYIFLYPSWGIVGTSVTITGIGLVASHNLTVKYDGSTAGMPTTCTTDAYGSITSGCTFTVPASAFGYHTITVTDGTNSPMAIFYVPAPYIYLYPSSGVVGTSVTIAGFDFLVSHSLTVMYDNSTAGMPTTCTTDAYGDINAGCTFTVPSSAVGDHYVTVTDGTNSATETFIVASVPPAIAIPGSISVGSGPYAVAVNPSTNRIYVANYWDNTVSVINGKTNLVMETIDVGGGPSGIAVNPSTNRIYVANYWDYTVSVIGGKTNLVTATIDVGGGPSGIAVNPSTNRIYVVNYWDNTVSVINGKTNLVTATIGVGIVGYGPDAVAVNTKTNTAYVTNTYENTVSVINGKTNLVTATIDVGYGPSGIAVNTKTSTMYVTNSWDNTVSVINGKTNVVIATIYVGYNPSGIAVNTKASTVYGTVYVTNADDNTVSVISGATNLVTETIGVGNYPSGIAVNTKTNTVYVANAYDNTISMITENTNLVTETIGVGNYPSGIAVNTRTNTVYVANYYDNTVSVINGMTNVVTATIDVGYGPDAVAVNPSTNRIYVVNYWDNTVSVINGMTNLVTATRLALEAVLPALQSTHPRTESTSLTL
ncbi:MAG: protease pro-enzyme activation domain-containing protein [Nitrososphaerales archaeon]